LRKKNEKLYSKSINYKKRNKNQRENKKIFLKENLEKAFKLR